MRHVVGPPTRWALRLLDGTPVIVWADAVSESEGHYVFEVLVDASEQEQADLDVTARTPNNAARVAVAVARFPVGSIEDPRRIGRTSE